MTRFALPSVVSVLILSASGAAFAQAPQPAPPGASAGLTLQQFEARHERKLLAMDTDGDGRISRAEFMAAAKPGKGDPAAKFAKLDRNGDGVIDKSEIDARLAHQFRKLDVNGDGILTPAERAAGKHGAAKDVGQSGDAP